jgi:hypothetical protein
MKQYNMQLTKGNESQWSFRLDMTVNQIDLVGKIMALVMDDANKRGKVNDINSGSCDSSYSWRETSNEIDEFLKPYLVGDEMSR